MGAYGAYCGSLLTHHDMSAVAAFPHLHLALGKHLLRLDVVEQRTIALLVPLLDGSHHAELLGQQREAFLVGRLCEAIVHVCPLIVLALGSSQQVVCCGAYAAQLLEPKLGVFLLVVGCAGEDFRHLLQSLLLGHRGEVGIFVTRLRLPGKCCLQVLLSLSALILVTHSLSLSFWLNVITDAKVFLFARRSKDKRAKRWEISA